MKTRILKYSLITVTAVAALFVAYGAGAGYLPFTSTADSEKDTSAAADIYEFPTVETRLVETHTVEYVEEVITETEYVNVIKNVPVELRNFTDLAEMEQWLDGVNNITQIRFAQDDSIADCDDYALEMQQQALSEGYIMSFEIIDGEEYNGLFSIPLPSAQVLHAINLAVIGNDVYYIEPQTGEVVHAAYLD